MSSFNNHSSQSLPDLDFSSSNQCPIMSKMNCISEDQQQEMMKMYETMLSSGHHGGLKQNQHNEEMKSKSLCPMQNQEIQENGSIKPISKSTKDELSRRAQEHESLGRPIMGCPFFNNEITDPEGKNITQGFPLKFKSKMDFIFKEQSFKIKKHNLNVEKSFLNSLPFAIKHSLFLDQDMMSKMRELSDLGQLFFITDDTKIRGNKSYDLGQYYQALDDYEQVLGCYLWIEFKDQEFRDQVFQNLKSLGITDNDVELKERQIIQQLDNDIETETKNAMIVGTLVNCMLAYMSMYHFTEALKCANFLIERYTQNSEIYYRKAQILYFDKSQVLQSLEDALEILEQHCLSQCKELKKLQKYRELEIKIKQEIELKTQQQLKTVSMIIRRSQKLMGAKKFPNEPTLQDYEVYQVLKIMNEKYPEIVQFFRDNENEQKLQKAVNEYQYFAKIFYDIHFVLTLDLKNLNHQIKDKLDQQDLDLISSSKINQVIDQAKYEVADSIFFHSNDLNSEIYNYAWEINQEKMQLRQKKQKENKIKQNKQSQAKDLKEKNTLIIGDLDRMTLANMGIFIVFAIILFYFGWGLEWINERHITQWLRAIYKSRKF